MDYDWCRINELVRHAAQGDTNAQALLVEEIRSYLRGLMERYGAGREATPDFGHQLLSLARRHYGEFWDRDPEFGGWIDGILQREVEAARGPG